VLRLKSIAILALCASLTPAFAQSLAEKKMHADVERSLSQKAETVAKACGATINVKFDWSTWQEAAKDKEVNFCMNSALNIIENICLLHPKDGKEAVQSKIKTFTCKVSSPRTLSLKDGEFVYGFDPKGPDWPTDGKVLEKFLMDNL